MVFEKLLNNQNFLIAENVSFLLGKSLRENVNYNFAARCKYTLAILAQIQVVHLYICVHNIITKRNLAAGNFRMTRYRVTENDVDGKLFFYYLLLFENAPLALSSLYIYIYINMSDMIQLEKFSLFRKRGVVRMFPLVKVAHPLSSFGCVLTKTLTIIREKDFCRERVFWKVACKSEVYFKHIWNKKVKNTRTCHKNSSTPPFFYKIFSEIITTTIIILITLCALNFRFRSNFPLALLNCTCFPAWVCVCVWVHRTIRKIVKCRSNLVSQIHPQLFSIYRYL